MPHPTYHTLPTPPPQVNEFQAACKRLPLALRDWPAYKDCRRTIDDFLDLLPLFQALAHKAIRGRWAGRQGVVGSCCRWLGAGQRASSCPT